MTFYRSTQWQPILKGNQLTRAPLTLKNAMMNVMLANDCQNLLFIYINNLLVGGTPLLDLWHYGG
jgi:hypothetical protein